MNVLIIDYGMGNLASVRRAFEEQGASPFVSANPQDTARASRIVLPGVGSFAQAMNNLKNSGWEESLRIAVLEKGMPLLGICLGMQLLADQGEEHGHSAGLGFIPGKVQRLPVPDAQPDLRIPHVGWNEITRSKDDPLLGGIDNGTDFYFVHSYYFNAAQTGDIAATTPYGHDFPCVVTRGNIYGTQFHPEKSGLAGFQIIRNFLAVR